MIRRVLPLALLAVSSTAWAYDPFQFCEGLYTNAQIEESLGTVSDAIKQADLKMAGNQLRDLEKDMICLSEMADPELLGSYAKLRSLVYFLSQDEDGAIKWGHLANHLNPNAELPLPLPEGHPFNTMWEDVEDTPAEGQPEGMQLNLPSAKGAMFIDGGFVFEPKAMSIMPHLVQLFDDNGEFEKGYWQEGDLFPEALLVASDKIPTKPPKWYDIETNTITVKQKKDKTGSDSKKSLPIMPIAAGGLAVLSGTLYAVAGATKGSINSDWEAGSLTEDSLRSKRSTANLMVVGAGVSGAAAVGLGVTGVLLNDGGGIAIHGRF